MPPPKSQGGALLTALFIMTLVAIVATAMTSRLQLDIYRTQLVINQDKLYLASQAVTFWALNELNNPKHDFNTTLPQGQVASYPASMQSLQKNIQIRGGLYDLQARFNVNNLVEKNKLLTFLHLIHQAIPKSNQNQSIQMALATLDWVSDYDPARGKDNYTAYYLAQNPAYYPSHQLMQSKSELRLVKEVSSKHYLALESFITTLPEVTPVNINTASKEVLMSLGNGISEQKINQLLEERASKPILKLNAVGELLKKIELPLDQITVQSTYFLSLASVSSEEQQLQVYTLFQRSFDKNKKLSVKIIRVSLNGF